jgi:hypothetical protein
MAEAAEQHTPREWSLDDYHRYVRVTMSCGINAALCEMERRVVAEQVLLICDGVAINRFDFLSNYRFQFDAGDRVRVVTRRPDARLFPGGITRITKFDEDGRAVRMGPGRVMDGYYTIVEQDARPSRPPAPQTAPARQLEDKVGPADRSSAGQSSQETKLKPDGWQTRRLRTALKEKYPPDGHPPVDMTLTAILQSVDAIYKRERWKLASPDCLSRLMGRRA